MRLRVAYVMAALLAACAPPRDCTAEAGLKVVELFWAGAISGNEMRAHFDACDLEDER